MLTKDEFLKQSAIINSLRFPATLLVIASHCVITTTPTSLPLEVSNDNIFRILEQLCLSFGPPAVALFSLITGYFFFYKLQNFDRSTYFVELKKRFHSLLIPYLLWNLIAIVALFAKNEIALRLGVDWGFNAQEYHFIQDHSIWKLIMLPVNNPLWYIREIIYLTLLSPLIYFIVKNRKVGLGLLILTLTASVLPKLNLGSIAVFFTIGAYLGFHKENIITQARRLRCLSYILGIGYPILRIFFHAEPWASNVSMYLIFFEVLAWINLSIDLYECKPAISSRFASFTPALFFMYAMHWILIINLVRGTLYALIPWDNAIEQILALLATVTIVPIITYYSYCVCSHLFPRLTQLLSGGRG